MASTDTNAADTLAATEAGTPKELAEAARKISVDKAQETLAEVTSWLGRLALLYGVPFQNLLPSKDLLPPESIRFFFLDPNWIQALIQGACSVGNTRYGDTIVDQVMNEWTQPNRPDGAPGGSSPTDTAAASVRDQLRAQHEGITPGETGQVLNWPLSGFLLRSQVVDGWRGLEIEAFDDHQEGLRPLRIEQLSRDVMLGLFNGVTHRLLIRQPQEGLHFGLTPDSRDGQRSTYSKSLRDMSSGETLPVEPINLTNAGMMRTGSASGVVDIAKLAQAMRAPLKDQLPKDHFGSAQFAVQMIEAPGEFTFIPDPES